MYSGVKRGPDMHTETTASEGLSFVLCVDCNELLLPLPSSVEKLWCKEHRAPSVDVMTSSRADSMS